ncbi:MAG: hypothetical protein ACUVQ5_03735 [Candidatus Methanomethylicaceae archaeon]
MHVSAAFFDCPQLLGYVEQSLCRIVELKLVFLRNPITIINYARFQPHFEHRSLIIRSRPPRERHIYRLAQTVCSAAGLAKDIALETAALAFARQTERRGMLFHVLAAALYASSKAGGIHSRLPGEWQEVAARLGLGAAKTGADAADGAAQLSIFDVYEYASLVYGPVRRKYWPRVLCLIPKKAVRRASLLLRPATAAEAAAAVLLADYSGSVTEEDLSRIKVRTRRAQGQVRSGQLCRCSHSLCRVP